MADPFSDRYWTDEFTVTVADLERIENRIRETCKAQDMTTLGERVIRGRLAHGADMSETVQLPAEGRVRRFRVWDPAGEWHVGDPVITTRVLGRHSHDVKVGEIASVKSDRATIWLDGIRDPAIYLRAKPGSDRAKNWYASIRAIVLAESESPELGRQLTAVSLSHGARVFALLQDALRADERFVRLAGRWFLRDLAVRPSADQLRALAWAMLKLDQPTPTDGLVEYVEPPLAAGDAGLFGLYLAMREHLELFENADPGQRPRWRLIGPPPGCCTATCAAYDPESYVVFCLPDEALQPETVQRLWEVGLLPAVV